MTNLLILHPDMSFGGTERQITNLVENLPRFGSYKIVIALYNCKGPLLEELPILSNVKIVDLRRSNSNYIAFLFRIRRLIQEENISVVYSFLVGPNIASALVTLTISVRAIVWGNRVSSFKQFEFGIRGVLADWCSRLLVKRVHLTICNSRAGEQELRERNSLGKTSVVIPNGIDLNKFSSNREARNQIRAELRVTSETVVICQIGRIVKWKGHEIFLKAAQELSRTCNDVVFVVVGDGDELLVNRLKDMAAEFGLETKIRWVGYRPDIATILNGIDVVTICSTSGEGFPNIIGEAMAVGKPVVASDIGSNAEILDKGGLIIPPGQTDELVEAWSSLIDNSDIRDQLGRMGSERVRDKYSIAKMVQDTHKYLQSLSLQ